MQMILINKKNNYMVEHIIPLKENQKFNISMYPEYYEAIEDKNNLIKEYDLRYNIETKSFEKIEGIKAFVEPYAKPSPISIIQKTLEEKDKTILNLKIALADTSEEKDNEILKLKLAIAELVEGGIK